MKRSILTPSVLLGALCATLTLGAVLGLAPPPPPPQNILGECALDFDDPSALGTLPDQAAFTFAPNYRVNCSTHWLNVEPLAWAHFHLSFEDPAISCLAPNGLGKMSGGNCVDVDWDNEPRFLQSHDQGKWTKIWLEDGSSQQPRAFDLRRIHVGGDKPIQLWYRTTNGAWWYWNELKGGKNWKVEKWSKNVMEVRIRGTNSGVGPYTIRNAYVHD